MADLEEIFGEGKLASEATTTEPVRTEIPAEGTTQEAEQPEGEAKPVGMVPHEALHAEKQKVKRYTEQVASFEQKLSETNRAWEDRFNRMLEKLGPQQQAEHTQPTDWFENPDEAFKQRTQQFIDPVVGQLRSVESKLARIEASSVFGDKFSEFLTVISEGKQKNDPEVLALEAMMGASDEPYVVAKKWFERRSFDPDAERERIRAELQAELGQQPQKPATAPVMPSNIAGQRNVGTRAGPAWAGPQPLDTIFANR